MGVFLASGLPIASADGSPSGTTPAIISSAFPYVFSNDTTTPYVLGSNEPANWSCVKCPYFSLLVKNPSSYASLLSSTGVPFNGSQTFSVKATMGGVAVYQNWTPKTLASSTISSLPSFTADVGVFYSYAPAVTNAGSGPTWSFSGAPYLTLNSATGRVSGVPSNTTAYTNVLTYSSSLGSWTQAWVTVPSTGTFPGTIAFSGTTLGHPVVATLPTTDVAGLGAGMVWLGKRPLLNFGSGTDGYSFTYVAVGLYTLDWTSGATTNKTLWAYGAPGTLPGASVNGHALSLGAFPSAGYENTTLTPPPKVTGISVTAETPLTLSAAWTNPAGAVADNLYYGLSCGTWVAHANLSLSTSYVVPSLLPSTTYCIAVGAVSLAGQGPLNYTNGTTKVLPPATGLSGKVYGSFVALTWTIPSSVSYTGESVLFGSVCGSWTETFPVIPPVDDLNISQLAGSYCVAVVLQVGASVSAPVFTNVTVAPINPPPAPVGLKDTGLGATNVTLHWNVTTRTTSYDVLYVTGTCRGFYPSEVKAGNVTKWNVTGLSPLTTYCFVIQAFNGTNGGSYSGTLSATTFSIAPNNGTTPPIIPPANPVPNPSTSILTVVNFFWLGVVTVTVVVIGVLYSTRRDRPRGRR